MYYKIVNTPSLEGLDIMECPNYHTALKEILSKKEYLRYYPELKQYYYFLTLPKSLQMNLVLADMQMVWNPDAKTFVSQGQLGVAICGKTEVNRYVPGIIEMQIKSTSRGANKSELRMYFEIGQDWFYFEYKSGILSAFSSIKEFNDLVYGTPSNKRTLEADANKGIRYEYKRGTLKMKNEFMKRYAKTEE
jgi:hypothetical protein